MIGKGWSYLPVSSDGLKGPMPPPLTDWIAIVVAIGARSEVPDFHGEIDVGLQCAPGNKVAKLRSVVFGMEAEVGSDAGVRICGLVAFVRAGYHEPGLTRGQILDHREYSSKVIARHILDGDA